MRKYRNGIEILPSTKEANHTLLMTAECKKANL
jgi:hypothetical protein